MPLRRSIGKFRPSGGSSGTHAHYADEFEALGRRQLTAKLGKSVEYRAARAAHFAREAEKANVAHAEAHHAGQKAKAAEHALVAAHAMKRAASHARTAEKLSKGSYHEKIAKESSDKARRHYDEIKSREKSVPDRDAKTLEGKLAKTKRTITKTKTRGADDAKASGSLATSSENKREKTVATSSTRGDEQSARHVGDEIAKTASSGDLSASRKTLDGHLASLGLQRDKSVSKGGVVTTRSETEMPVAGGYHSWDGEITLRRDIADRARQFATSHLAGQSGASLDDLRGRADRIGAERLKLSTRSNSPKIKAKIDTLFKEEYALNQEITARSGSQDSFGMHALVHESLHEYSPGTENSYVGRGAKIEEITTDVSARVIMNKMFGVRIPRHDDVDTAYHEEITAATTAISKITGKSMDESYLHLQEAAMTHKRRQSRSLHDEDEVATAFSYDVAKTIGRPVSEVEQVMRDHLK